MTDAVKALLIYEAESNLATKYPQYKGHWDGWSVGQLKRDVLSRAAVKIGSKGDFVLYDPASLLTDDDPAVEAGWRRAGFVVAYFPGHYAEGGSDYSVEATNVLMFDTDRARGVRQ